MLDREIGVVLSGARASAAPIALRSDAESDVREEQLVVIRDPRFDGRYLMLGVLRSMVFYEPFLRRGVRTVYAEYPEALADDLVLPFSNAYVEIYCGLDLESKRIVENTVAPKPSSRVYLVERGDELSEYIELRGSSVNVGWHKYSGWNLPLDSFALRYHVGVFGATGMGKSRLVRALINEIIEKTDYSLIVFDHTGVDYAPFYPSHVVRSDEVALSPPVISSILVSLSRLSWQTYGEYFDVAVLCYWKMLRGEAGSVSECIYGSSRPQSQLGSGSQQKRGVEKWSKEEFLKVLDEAMRLLKAREPTRIRARMFVSHFVPDEFFEKLNERTITAEELVERARKDKLVVIDMSYDRELVVKQALIRDVADACWEAIRREQRELNLGLVVDEAQNYAGEQWSLSAEALETIAREGRKWGFFVILASQRVARDIRTSIRANLGTVFFSKLQATGDLKEIAGYLDIGGLSESSLAMLAPREFFVAGLMNPLARPILLRIKEVEG